MLHVGIDPGLRGAIVGLNDDGSLGLVWDMPTSKVTGQRGRSTTVVDVSVLADRITRLADMGIRSLTIEEPFWKPDSRYKEGEYKIHPAAAMKARLNSGLIYGMCVMAHRDTKLVQPALWKRGVGIETGADKAVSIRMACSLFPNNAKDLQKDGRAEASLISYYGMRNARVIERIVKR